MDADLSPHPMDPLDSDYLPVDLVIPETSITTVAVRQQRSMERCAVCGRPAFCYNYGVLSCNACKMFFRRVEVDQITYTCKYWKKCYDGHEFVDVKSAFPRCRFCRYQRCVDVGMKYIQPGKPEIELELANKIEEKWSAIIGNLLFLDSRRRHKILNFYTSEDPTLTEMVTRGKVSRMVMKAEGQKVELHEWSFFGIYASVELFMSMDFMQAIPNVDKITLLRNFCLKSLTFSSAFRSAAANMDRIMTPDGNDVYPDVMYQMSLFSKDFLNSIRSRLVVRCLELKITIEEQALLNMLFFCNPALSLSEDSRKIITSHQKLYSSSLFKYCCLTYQQNGPSRFTDLLSLCHVMNKQATDINYLTTLFQLYMPSIRYKKLFVDVCI